MSDLEVDSCIFCGSNNLWRYGAENPLKCGDCDRYQTTEDLEKELEKARKLGSKFREIFDV